MRLWETLLAATERKGTRLNQASQQQQFNRGVEDLEIWLCEVEGQLLSEDYGNLSLSFLRILKFMNGTGVDLLIK